MADISLKDYLERRRTSMSKERSSFISHYKDMADNIQPRRGRFYSSDRNKGTRRHNLIINSKGTQALRTATAGLFSGIMSPTRPWFNLSTPDPGLMEFMPVKIWLSMVEQILRSIFNASNLYNMAPSMLSEVLLFGTGCMLHVDDFEDVARFYTQTAGSYYIAQDDRLVVNTLLREYEMTVMQIVTEFGLDNVSKAVKEQYDRSNYEDWIKVVHLIEPNPENNVSSLFSVNKDFRSIYYEPGSVDKNKVLRQKGFDEFPVYAPRWGLTGEDVYGTDSPGMVALGDVRGLQIEEKRKAQAIDKMVNPPLKGPASIRNVPINSLPGGVTLYQGDSSGEGLSPLYMVNPQIQALMEDISKVEQRIDEAFFVDLFLAISNMEGIQPKNQLELSQRNEERLLQLGPVLEQLHGEFLDKVVTRTFNQALAAGILPPPPPELEGLTLKINYISSLAQAQRAVATGGIDRMAAFVVGLAEANPNVLDKFDFDQAVDEYALALLTPPKIIKSDEMVAKEREARAQQEQQAQQMAMAEQAAGIAKDVGSTIPDDVKQDIGDRLAGNT